MFRENKAWELTALTWNSRDFNYFKLKKTHLHNILLCFSFSCQAADLCTNVLFLFILFKQTKLFIFAEPDQFKSIQELF